MSLKSLNMDVNTGFASGIKGGTGFMRSTHALMITVSLLTTGALMAIQPQICCVSVASAAEVAPTMKLLKPAKLHAKASGPSKVLEIVWTDATGQRLDQQGEWIQLRMEKNGRTGWVHESYLKAVSPPQMSPPKAVTPPPSAEYEITQPINGPQLKLSRASGLHAEASATSTSVEKIDQNEVVTWLDKQDVWVRVAINRNGHTGWIHQSDLAPASMAVATPADNVTATAQDRVAGSAPGTASTPEPVTAETTAPATTIDTGMAASGAAASTAPAMDMGNWQQPARAPKNSPFKELAIWGVISVVILVALFWLLSIRRKKAAAAATAESS